jgi:hypothetical protein
MRWIAWCCYWCSCGLFEFYGIRDVEDNISSSSSSSSSGYFSVSGSVSDSASTLSFEEATSIRGPGAADDAQEEVSPLNVLLDLDLVAAFQSLTPDSANQIRLIKISQKIHEMHGKARVNLVTFSKFIFLNASDRNDVLFLLKLCNQVSLYASFRSELMRIFYRKILIPFMVEHVDDAPVIIECLRFLKFRTLNEFCQQRQNIFFSAKDSNNLSFLMKRWCL